MLREKRGSPLTRNGRWLRAEEVPPLVRREHVTGGYRPYYYGSVGPCLKSIFQYHNESMNIWTHLYPSLFALLVLASSTLGLQYFAYAKWKPYEAVGMDLFILSVATCFGASAVFHCLNAHSEHAYHRTLTFDLYGIFVYVGHIIAHWISLRN